MKSKNTEGELVKAVMELLQAHGFQVWKRNTGAVTTSYKGKERFFRFSEPGMSDIWGWEVDTGRHIEVEVKRKGLKPTVPQLLWLQGARAAGCVAFWCDSMEMAEDGLRKEGVNA